MPSTQDMGLLQFILPNRQRYQAEGKSMLGMNTNQNFVRAFWGENLNVSHLAISQCSFVY